MSNPLLKRRKVLVLDSDASAGVEVVQSLGASGCQVHVVRLDPRKIKAQSRYIRKQVLLDISNPDQLEPFVAHCIAERYDLIVPTTEVALLAMLSPQVPEELYRIAVLPSRGSIHTALDKQAVWDLAHKLGIRVPSSTMVSPAGEPPSQFPVVLKPTFSRQTVNGDVREYRVTIARDIESWRSALQFDYALVPVQQQQYVTGKGVGLEMIFDHGKPCWAFLHERVHELPITGGGSSYRVSLAPREDLVEIGTQLLSALDWHGVAMVEFKVTHQGQAYLMEINPRLWGSLALSIDCGVNFPFGLLCLATGETLPPQPGYRTGYFTRNIYRDVEWFKANLKADHSDPLLLTRPVPRTLLEWLRPLTGRESWDFFCWSDPGMLVGELKLIAREHWGKVVNAVRTRAKRLYLRYLQQPLMLQKLRGRKIDKVLVLCYGNICRSPVAAALAERRFPNASFQSAGFHPTAGRQSPEFVLATAESLGIDLAAHRSKRVNAKMIDEADLILIMDMRNRNSLTNEFPLAIKKTLFLGMLLPKPELEIRDPYDRPGTMPDVSERMNRAIERMSNCLRQS